MDAVVAGSADAARINWPVLAIAEALPPCPLPPERPWPAPVALLFTSGSSGQPQVVPKSFAAIRGELECLRSRLPSSISNAEFATAVPMEHMYGYVFAFWLPHRCGARLVEKQIVLPQDLRETCATARRPLWLVTTPTHLRAWCEAGTAYPNVAGILCATAPLGSALAHRARSLFGADIIEIYGSTETGAVATRHWQQTVIDPLWQALPGLRIETNPEGKVVCEADHLEGRLVLADRIACRDGGFDLQGRDGDMVKVFGKRHSLAGLNEALLSLAGVRDGVFVSPALMDPSLPDGGRLAAFVVAAEAVDRGQLLDALGQRIDPVFLPRPMFLVDRLPRTPTGKLRRDDLVRLWQRYREERISAAREACKE